MSQVGRVCPLCRSVASRDFGSAGGGGFFTEYKQAEEQRQLKQEVAHLLKEAEAFMNCAGGPVWVPLDIDMKYRCAFFVSRDIVAQMPYHVTGGSIDWSACSLRQWLDGSFFGSLPAHIRSRVIEVTNQNPGYGNTTRDKVFLLSGDEANKYFCNDYDRIAKFNDSASWWWLRSPGSYQNEAAYVGGDGNVCVRGSNVTMGNGGVRPALILNLNA